MFDEQTIHNHDQLRKAQEYHAYQRTRNEKDTDAINMVLAQEKKERELMQHEVWSRQEKHEVDYTNNHDFMTENKQTEISMLAPHRVKPYHFKGFTQAQKDQVNLERQMQIKEAELMKK